MAPLADDLTAFALDLYAQLRMSNSRVNSAFSPLSVAAVLAMIEQGAKGDTAKQIATALHTSTITAAELAASTAELIDDLGRVAKSGGIELNLANAVWVQRTLHLEQAFVDVLDKVFRSGLQQADFRANPDRTRQAVNAWAARQTRDLIRELLPAGLVDTFTRLILTNAVYLKATWATPFPQPLTRDDVFHRLDGDVKVPFMHLDDATLAASTSVDYDAVQLPYVGGRLAALVLAPRAGRLGDFEQHLDPSTLQAALNGLRAQPVRLALPRFTLRFEQRLDAALRAMGMVLPFTVAADFTGISRDEPLAVQFVQHQAYVKTDETGTEAAAATAGGIMAVSSPVAPRMLVINVNRPFIFIIRDVETGAVLFVSRVLDPSVSAD